MTRIKVKTTTSQSAAVMSVDDDVSGVSDLVGPNEREGANFIGYNKSS